MQLIDVYDGLRKPFAVATLYELLSERRPFESISHQKMPTVEEHKAFIDSVPYAHWYIINTADGAVGSIYLTENREIGVFVLKSCRGRGHARAAVKMLMDLHPGNILANVNPENETSCRMWESMGWEIIQVTYSSGGREGNQEQQAKMRRVK